MGNIFLKSFEILSKRFLVLLSSNQFGSICVVTDFKFYNPAFPVRVGIQKFWLAFKFAVELYYSARNRQKQVGNRLHCFNTPKNIAGGKLVVHSIYIHNNNIAKFALGKICYSYRSYVAINPHPFVIFGVL